MKPFFELTKKDVSEWFEAQGERSFRTGQLFDWVYAKKESDPDQMTTFSKELRQKISSAFSFETCLFSACQVSSDKQTEKYLWKLPDNQFVESVLIKSGDRRTVCVSSQVGCNARCAFCASGKEGLVRNLTAAEIVEQVYCIDRQLAKNGERVSHIVFMGMGEPLDNYENVIRAIQQLSSPDGIGISQRRITVSTSGVIEGVRRFAEEGLKVNLVLSLHAPNQMVRKKIMPYARKNPFDELLEAMFMYGKESGRDATFEYILIAGINDRPVHAEELVRLLKGKQCTVNLIPYNPVAGLKLKRPTKECVDAFREVLEKHRLTATQRYTKGKDIAAACGQLALKKKEEKRGKEQETAPIL